MQATFARARTRPSARDDRVSCIQNINPNPNKKFDLFTAYMAISRDFKFDQINFSPR